MNDSVSYIPASECVVLIDSMGTDMRVVNAARVSFNNWIDESKPLTQRDTGLIKYLATHDHISPFFHPVVCFRLRMPICVAREWFRHTVGFARNEVSRRYVTSPVQCFLPGVAREKHETCKQGSKETGVDDAVAMMEKSMEASVATYRELLEMGVAPEVARMVLPQSAMTEFIETASLAAYVRLYKLRSSGDAQAEIRAYAEAVGVILERMFPVSWAACVAEISNI